MIDREVFAKRREICLMCSWWRGACRKGHVLQGAAGCPLRKFPPVSAADYAPDRQVEVETAPVEPCCGPPPAQLKPMTYMEAIAHFRVSMARWQKEGCPITPGEQYAGRIATCKTCPSNHYAWFQCSECKCVVYTKAGLATEHCPVGHW